MRSARDTLVMLLAGGVGSRLNILASRRAKPAVPFGGAYRIIDFTLSNVMRSGLERVGLLTQYKPFSLMDHVRSGEPWDLLGRDRGIKVLPPYTGETESDWYKGTADAVYQNLWFMEDYAPDKVLILSGDHIYRMDYERMIRAHEEAGADLTIAALQVPWEETQRFGVMVTDERSWIVEFQEKVAGARSNLASMGVYVFNYEALVEEMRAIVATKRGFDFGKDIIPGMLGRRKLLCYPFDGYWRDVGTLRSYLEANMDCLSPASGLDLASWQIATNSDQRGHGDRGPALLARGAEVVNSLIGRGCSIAGEVRDSILFPGVRVERGARVCGSVLMSDSVIGAGSAVDDAILDKKVRLGAGTVIGDGDPTVANRANPTHLDSGISVIGKEAIVAAGTSIGRNCIVHPRIEVGGRSRRIEDGETVTA